MDYQYDAFFSYKRDPQSDAWHYAVKEKLQYWLQFELNKLEVKIFLDSEDIRTGQRWRQKLEHALRGSKCLACVWSPLYFQSRWCVSEWRTFLAREQASNCDLVLPARYSDVKWFPVEAKAKQTADFSNYTSTMPRFWETEPAVEFEKQCLKRFAKDLGDLIRNAPPFDPAFPIIEAEDDQVSKEDTIGRIASV